MRVFSRACVKALGVFDTNSPNISNVGESGSHSGIRCFLTNNAVRHQNTEKQDKSQVIRGGTP